MFLRQRHAAQAGVAYGLPGLRREFLAAVLVAPVVEAEIGAHPARRFDDHVLVFG